MGWTIFWQIQMFWVVPWVVLGLLYAGARWSGWTWLKITSLLVDAAAITGPLSLWLEALLIPPPPQPPADDHIGGLGSMGLDAWFTLVLVLIFAGGVGFGWATLRLGGGDDQGRDALAT